MARRAAFNPFYHLLVVLGIAFCITACAYGVMALRAVRPDFADQTSASGGSLMQLVDEHGAMAMLVELVLLAVVTAAAIGTDGFWTRRAQRKQARVASPPSGETGHG